MIGWMRPRLQHPCCFPSTLFKRKERKLQLVVFCQAGRQLVRLRFYRNDRCVTALKSRQPVKRLVCLTNPSPAGLDRRGNSAPTSLCMQVTIRWISIISGSRSLETLRLEFLLRKLRTRAMGTRTRRNCKARCPSTCMLNFMFQTSIDRNVALGALAMTEQGKFSADLKCLPRGRRRGRERKAAVPLRISFLRSQPKAKKL